MPSSSGPADLLADLARGLGALGVSWYVFGAQAVLIWGRPRLTTDVDVTVRLGAHSTEQLVDHLSRSGFVLRVPTTAAFVRDTRVLPLTHTRSGMAVDVVLAGPGLEDLFLERAVAVDVGGTTVPVIAPEPALSARPGLADASRPGSLPWCGDMWIPCDRGLRRDPPDQEPVEPLHQARRGR